MSPNEQFGTQGPEDEMERQQQEEQDDPTRQSEEGDEGIGPDTPEKLTNAGEM